MLAPPVKTPTPYGGRLTWLLPGGNRLKVHIKDNNKIRNRKRWSQVGRAGGMRMGREGRMEGGMEEGREG